MNNKSRERARREREWRMGRGRRTGTSRSTLLMIILGALAAGLVLILGLVWLTGRDKKPGTVTPSPVASPIVGVAEATPTSTPEPPTQTPTPSPDELLKTARSCKVTQNTSLRLLPSESAAGDTVSAGLAISVTTRSVEPKGWLEVVRNGSLRYIKADQVDKGCGV